MSLGTSWAGPAAGNVYPFGQTAALLALDIDNVRVASAAAADAVLLLGIPLVPVLVLLEAFLFVQRRLLEIRLPGKLPRWGIGGTVLDRRMSVAEVAEVVYILDAEEGAGRKGVYGRITPLVDC